MTPVRLFAVFAYACFQASFLGFVAFVTGFWPARATGGTAAALAIDAALVLFFGVTHSVMARPGFKRRWTAIIPAAAERSVYVLVSSVQVALLCWQWRPVSGPALWSAGPTLAVVLTGVQLLGFGIAFLATCLIDHFELFGLRQAFAPRSAPPEFRTPGLYRIVRHPLYFGLLIAFWAAPSMSLGRLALAAGLTLYVVIGVRFEERDLVTALGEPYRRYQREVSMLLPVRRGRLS